MLRNRYAEPSPSMPAPPVPMLRLDTSAAFSPTNEPASSTFGNFSFPNGPSSSYRQPALGLPGGQTSREEEIVRPRGSVAVREDYASEERTLGPRWDLEGLKDDKADVNTCEYSIDSFLLWGQRLMSVTLQFRRHKEDISWSRRRRDCRFQNSISRSKGGER
jgi:hypothetical protein